MSEYQPLSHIVRYLDHGEAVEIRYGSKSPVLVYWNVIYSLIEASSKCKIHEIAKLLAIFHSVKRSYTHPNVCPFKQFCKAIITGEVPQAQVST